MYQVLLDTSCRAHSLSSYIFIESNDCTERSIRAAAILNHQDIGAALTDVFESSAALIDTLNIRCLNRLELYSSFLRL